MPMGANLNRKPDESLTDYHVRLYMNLDNYGIDTHKATELLNKDAGTNFGESKWRKDYAQYVRWNDYIVSKNLDEDVMAKYEEAKVQAEISKVQNADQKREYRKMIRHEARFLAIKDTIESSLSRLNTDKPFISVPPPPTSSEKEDLVLFSDWHFGMEVKNRLNLFNKDIFNKRVGKLVAKTIEYGKRNGISKLHVAQLGDIFAGQIHTSTRVQSNEDLIDQITYVSEVLAEVLTQLANEFNEIVYYNVIGNHARAGKKDEVAIKENYEYLIPWYLQARLQKLNNIEFVSDDDGLIEAEICNEKVIFAHGNFDSISSSFRNLPQLLGYTPALIFTGHVHHSEEKDFGTTKHIINPSLIGVDDYAVSRRLFSKPSQKYITFDKQEGLEGVFDIKLHNVG